MTTAPTPPVGHTTPARIVLCLPAREPARGSVALAGAMSLFPRGAELVLCLAGVDQPSADQAERISALCRSLAGDRIPLPELTLVGERAARAGSPLLVVEATGDPLDTAEALALMSAAAQALWDRSRDTGGGLRSLVDTLIRRRDGLRRAGPPLVVAVAQVQSTWPAIADICNEMRERAQRGEIAFEVLALESEHDVREQSTADFLREQGHAPRDLDWFTAQVQDETSPLAQVLTESPWDGLRPKITQAITLAEAGVRLAYVPYGNNVGAGEKIMSMAYDLPTHRLAWRAFARSDTQRELWVKHCTTGADHVRVLGLPKLDRVVRLCRQTSGRGEGHPVRALAGDRPVVLWNPHFTFGPEGWSTFNRYLGPITRWAAAHPGMVLLIRPHFRLFRDLPLMGPSGQRLLDALHRAATDHANIVIDTATDYLPAFAVADAFVSDISSLITEWVPTGRPVCYLHKCDGPGANEDAQYLFELDVATSWAGLEAFLQTVLAGLDPGRDRRKLVVERHFPFLDGLGAQRISEELVGSLLTETSPAVLRELVEAR